MPKNKGKSNGKRFNNFNRHNQRNNRPFQKSERPAYRHQNQLSEEDVGITEFVSDLKGFSAIIKARFSDFHVNEINLDGKLAKLTDKSIPKDFMEKIFKIDYKSVTESPHEFIPQEKWEDIKKLLEVDAEVQEVTVDANNLSKEDRCSIHNLVKSHFGEKIIVDTVKIDDNRVMKFRKCTKETRKDNRVKWPSNKGEYVHFLVYKEGVDTMDACFQIANALRMSPSNFHYAGVKDRRGKTTQWFSARKIEPWKIITKTKSLRFIHLGNIDFKDQQLKMGDLLGNKFRIALRNVLASDEEINHSMEMVKQNGFVNYYGLQRFGNDKEVPTYEIGIKLLRGEWKEAIDLILKPKSSDNPSYNLSKAKKVYAETHNAQEALKLLREDKKCHTALETQLFEGLSKVQQNEFVTALESIPRNVRILYLHAFQSLIWNKMVSKRIKTFGSKPVEGDLVLENSQNEEVAPTNSEEDDILSEDIDDSDLKCNQKIKVLKTDDLPNYSIFDIVLPLPGFDIIYPENMKEFYKEAIEECGLMLEMPKQKVKCYNLGGTYRHVMCEAKELSWQIMYYNDPTDNLILSDFEEMKGHSPPKSVEGGKYKALVMEMILPAAAYATIFLREVLRTCTSSSAQAKLNNYHESKGKIICTSEEEVMDRKDQTEETIEQTPNSLLADKAKYDEFKNSIFKDIFGSGNSGESSGDKRKNEDVDGKNEDESSAKKVKENEDKMDT